MQEAAPAPGSPMKIPGLGSIFCGTKPDPSASKGFCRSLDIIAFLPREGWQQTDCPDNSIEGSWGAGVGATSRCVLCCLQIQVTPWLPTSLSQRLVINNLTLHPPNGLSLGRFPALLWEQRGGRRRGPPGPISLSKN